MKGTTLNRPQVETMEEFLQYPEESRKDYAINGYLVPVKDTEEAKKLSLGFLDVLVEAFGLNHEVYDIVSHIEDRICEYNKTNKVAYVTVYSLMDMPCICYVIDKNTKGGIPAPLIHSYGTPYKAAFCYVLNLAADHCSEFGDVFFKKLSGGCFVPAI